MKRRSYPEEDIQRAVVSHLRLCAASGVVWWHTPSGAKFGGKKSSRGVPLQAIRLKEAGWKAGVSDILAFHKGKFYALELKAPGGRPTKEQLGFLSEVAREGGYVCVAEGIDRALAALEAWGLLTNTIRVDKSPKMG